MKQRYLLGFLLAVGIGAGCQQDKYLLEVYATTRYDVLKLPAPAEAASLLAVAFPSASVGYVGDAGGVLYATANGGQSWTSRTQPALGDIRKLYFSSATAGWVATSNGLYQTTNGGQTWQRTQYATASGPYGYIGAAWDVRFLTAQVGYAAATGSVGFSYRFARPRPCSKACIRATIPTGFCASRPTCSPRASTTMPPARERWKC